MTSMYSLSHYEEIIIVWVWNCYMCGYNMYVYVKIQSYTVRIQNEMRESTGNYTEVEQRPDHEVIEDSLRE